MMAWLSNLETETIKLAAQVASTLVALLALFIGLRNEARNQRRFELQEARNQGRFELQLSQSREVALATAKPVLAIEREGYEDVKAISIANHGPGIAICYVINFMRGEKKALDISELIEIEYNIIWNESTAYATPYYIPGKSKEDAFRITEDRLRECKVPPAKLGEVLADIERQLDEIEVLIEYEDVFGSKFRLDDGPINSRQIDVSETDRS